MARLDAEWLSKHGRTIRPTIPPRALYDRLKFVAGLIAAAAPSPLRGPRLLWRNERGEVEVLVLQDELVIGRDSGCGLPMTHPRVSRRHCKITVLHGVVWVSDLCSTNGTMLNGERISAPLPLRDGDLLEVGGAVLAFVRSHVPEQSSPEGRKNRTATTIQVPCGRNSEHVGPVG